MKLRIKLAIIGLLVCLLVAIINFYVYQIGKNRIIPALEQLPQTQAVLILGSRVYENGNMSAILKDRVDTGLLVYQKGKASKILISGDHGRTTYDEVNTIKDYLLAHGVPAEDIFLDHAGFDTYDSLYRAKAIFKVKSLIIITQQFHLPRALYLGHALGLEVYGFASDLQLYQSDLYNNLREIPARTKAFLDINLNSSPKFLGPTIPIDGDSKLSWD